MSWLCITFAFCLWTAELLVSRWQKKCLWLLDWPCHCCSGAIQHRDLSGSAAVWALKRSKQNLPPEDELSRRRRLHLALPQRWVPQAAGMLNLSPHMSCLCCQKEGSWAPCWHNSPCSYFSKTPTAVRRVMVQTRILPWVSRAVTQLASPLWSLKRCLVMNKHPAASHSFKKKQKNKN